MMANRAFWWGAICHAETRAPTLSDEVCDRSDRRAMGCHRAARHRYVATGRPPDRNRSPYDCQRAAEQTSHWLPVASASGGCSSDEPRSLLFWHTELQWNMHQKLNDTLRQPARQALNRDLEPSISVLDSQSGTTAEAGGERGFNGGTKGQQTQTAINNTTAVHNRSKPFFILVLSQCSWIGSILDHSFLSCSQRVKNGERIVRRIKSLKGGI